MWWLLALVFAYPAFWILQCFYRLFFNWLDARRSGLPYVVSPMHPEFVPWIVISPAYHKQLKQYLPTALWNRLRVLVYGWELRLKYSAHEEYGESFIIVNFYKNILIVGDPDVGSEILKRPRDFFNSTGGDFIMGKFGRNLVTSRLDVWARQRKFIAATINEKISATVFQESKDQADQMMQHYEKFGGTTTDTAHGLKAIAMNVLASAGYGQNRPWLEDKEAPPPGFHVTYMQAMKLLVENLVQMAFLPPSVLLLPLWSKTINDVGHSVQELPALTNRMLHAERENRSSRTNIMSLMVHEDAGNGPGKANNSNRLHDDEMVGNLFVFTAAGFDTTANTMHYALALLTSYPEWQDWIIEEIDSALAGQPNTDDIEYEQVYPKLTRTLALMHETLRVYAPLVHLAKYAETDLPIVLPSGKQVTIPASTTIHINSYALHHHPKLWDKPEEFNPQRFVGTDAGGKPCVKAPPKGAFVPWSMGPRVCPGMKMAMVEFVTVFMMIFRRHRVELVLRDGETAEQGKMRARECMEDSGPRLTMQMNRPQDLEVRFVKRW